LKSKTTRQFREDLASLPEAVRQQARSAYRTFRDNPHHPGLQFKRVHPTLPIYSARVSSDYRAVGVRNGGEIVWFFIGSHTEYEHLLKRL
jgi:mRNA-degrading endonuclease RelE of RelBE toxin-antitoxin system